MSGKSYEIEIGAQSIYKISLNRSFESSGRVSDATWIAISNWREIFDIGGRIRNGDIKSTVVIQYPPARFLFLLVDPRFVRIVVTRQPIRSIIVRNATTTRWRRRSIPDENLIKAMKWSPGASSIARHHEEDSLDVPWNGVLVTYDHPGLSIYDPSKGHPFTPRPPRDRIENGRKTVSVISRTSWNDLVSHPPVMPSNEIKRR